MARPLEYRTHPAYKVAVIRRRINFQGRVQGVGFRATTRHVAQGFPISGWVLNEPDGSVTAEIQGVNEQVEAFLAELRTHMGRKIARESVQTIPAVPSESGFTIRH